MTQIALDLPATATFDEWSDLGRRLCAGARTMNWLIGDWLIAGSDRYGEKARDKAREIFRSDVERFAPILDTCRRFPEAKRHLGLTFGHHQAVLPVQDEAEADRLLSDAETLGMTVSALKAQVRVSADRQGAMLDDDPEDAAYRRIVHAWNLASRASRQAFIESAEEVDLGVIEL